MIQECKNIENKNYDIKNYGIFNNIKIPEQNEIDDIIEKIKNIFSINKFIFKSSILKIDLKRQNIINSWIKEKLNKNLIKYELIFKMSENGSECIDFLKYCNNKGPTLTIIETKNNNIFGGFTPLNWNIPDNYIFNKLIDRSNKENFLIFDEFNEKI